MEELINRLKEITNLSELENVRGINPNALIYAIAKSERYELLNGANIRLNISDNDTLEKLTDFLLSDGEYSLVYCALKYGSNGISKL